MQNNDERISFPEKEDIGPLKELWKESFGDTDDYIDRFFGTFFKRENTLVMFYKGELAGVVYYIDAEAYYLNRKVKGAYLYSVAVRKKWRYYGLFTALHRELIRILMERGIDFVYAIPGETALFPFYAKFGYKPVFRKMTYRIREVGGSYTFADAADEAVYRLYLDYVQENREGFVLCDSREAFAISREEHQILLIDKEAFATFERRGGSTVIGEYIAPRLNARRRTAVICKSQKSGVFLPLSETIDLRVVEKSRPILTYMLN